MVPDTTLKSPVSCVLPFSFTPVVPSYPQRGQWDSIQVAVYCCCCWLMIRKTVWGRAVNEVNQNKKNNPKRQPEVLLLTGSWFWVLAWRQHLKRCRCHGWTPPRRWGKPWKQEPTDSAGMLHVWGIFETFFFLHRSEVSGHRVDTVIQSFRLVSGNT